MYFGDVKANVYAVDAETGAQLWTKSAESHPLARVTGAPVLFNGRLYVPVASFEEGSGPNPKYECCTFRGSVVAYDAANGEQIWKTYTIPEKPRPTKKNSVGTQLWGPAGAAVWSAPTIDAKRGALYVATGDAYTSPAADTSDAIMAFDLKSGIPLWTHQFTPNDAFLVGCPSGPNTRDNCPDVGGPDFDFGNSPILRTLPNGKSVLVIGQKSGAAWAIDPDKDGALLWQHKVGSGSALGGVEWGSAADDQHGYFAVADQQLGANAGATRSGKRRRRPWSAHRAATARRRSRRRLPSYPESFSPVRRPALCARTPQLTVASCGTTTPRTSTPRSTA